MNCSQRQFGVFAFAACSCMSCATLRTVNDTINYKSMSDFYYAQTVQKNIYKVLNIWKNSHTYSNYIYIHTPHVCIYYNVVVMSNFHSTPNNAKKLRSIYTFGPFDFIRWRYQFLTCGVKFAVIFLFVYIYRCETI